MILKTHVPWSSKIQGDACHFSLLEIQSVWHKVLKSSIVEDRYITSLRRVLMKPVGPQNPCWMDLLTRCRTSFSGRGWRNTGLVHSSHFTNEQNQAPKGEGLDPTQLSWSVDQAKPEPQSADSRSIYYITNVQNNGSNLRFNSFWQHKLLLVDSYFYSCFLEIVIKYLRASRVEAASQSQNKTR